MYLGSDLWVPIRDGHADADDAEVCGLMRICGCDSEDKICMRIVGKKEQGQKKNKIGAQAPAHKKG